jgi:hypothetical protein
MYRISPAETGKGGGSVTLGEAVGPDSTVGLSAGMILGDSAGMEIGAGSTIASVLVGALHPAKHSPTSRINHFIGVVSNLVRLSFDGTLYAVSEVTAENAAKIPSVYHR